MKFTLKSLVFTIITLALACVTLTLGLLSRTATAQGEAVEVVHMTGSADGVWIATNDQRLIHCWFPQSPSRREARASCRVIDRWLADVIR